METRSQKEVAYESSDESHAQQLHVVYLTKMAASFLCVRVRHHSETLCSLQCSRQHGRFGQVPDALARFAADHFSRVRSPNRQITAYLDIISPKLLAFCKQVVRPDIDDEEKWPVSWTQSKSYLSKAVNAMEKRMKAAANAKAAGTENAPGPGTYSKRVG